MIFSFVKRIRKENTSYKIYLPKEMIEALKLKEGDFVKIVMEKLEVKKNEKN